MTDEALLAELLAQEERLVFERFDNDTAIALGEALVARGRREKLAITVDICRGEQQIYHCALAGTVADNDHWVARKNAVVRRFGHSSYYMGVKARVRGVDLSDSHYVDPRAFSAHGGAFPIIVRHVGLVGTATVSGLPQADDHALVVAVIEEFLGALPVEESGAEVWTA
ncbi:heme-degrading domain-containing protein [Prosthecomicrobium pneumaticum]|uniref:UPF0303 protein GGQ63_001483 n=1 Tax=Prosthecomicrobium pneumaticum TaxID=81895 RepID=A0A7W9FL82_9HYPH|nr:heme-degrading domain-containing protein [Prosthecomicrobium pneumaticum]MBB5752429.1 uncharacterized protein (UPF0303 family) [Prosthecomicrobium pneumaticum]